MKPATINSKIFHRNLLISLVILVFVIISIVAVAWFYILRISNEVNRYNAEIYLTQAETSKLTELSWRYQKAIPYRSLVLGTIPSTKEESTFMADIETLAGKNGLVITSSSVGNSQTKAAKTGEFSQTLSKDNYFELPIKYEVSGNYSSFVNFIGELSSIRRLSSVNDVSITADFSDKATSGRVRANFIVTIYAKK